MQMHELFYESFLTMGWPYFDVELNNSMEKFYKTEYKKKCIYFNIKTKKKQVFKNDICFCQIKKSTELTFIAFFSNR